MRSGYGLYPSLIILYDNRTSGDGLAPFADPILNHFRL